MRYNTFGVYNTAVGYETLYSNTIGAQNTAIGNSALYTNIDGDYNTSIGYNSLLVILQEVKTPLLVKLLFL